MAAESAVEQYSLVELATWLGEGKRIVAVVTIAAAALSIGVSYLLPVRYTSTTTLLAPTPPQSAAAGAIAALATTGALGSTFGNKTPDELYVSLLRSDTVLHALDDRFKLKERYDVPNFVKLRTKIPRFVTIMADKKSGLITIEVDDEDPKFAAELSNAFATEVQNLLGKLAVSEAQMRRLFFEQQLKNTKEVLATAEQTMRQVQERSGVIVLDKQAEAMIGGAAQIRTLIADREVQLKVLRASATEQNPDVIRLSSEVRALRAELARMDSTQGGGSSALDMPVGRLPEASIDYIRAKRDLKLQETLLEGLIKQFELARMDEAKEGATLQLVESGRPADHKSKPARAIIVAVGTVLGFLLACSWVIGRGFLFHRKADPEGAAAWQSLRRAWRLGR